MTKTVLLPGLLLAALATAPVQGASPYPQSTLGITWEQGTWRAGGAGGDIWPIATNSAGALFTAWGDGIIGCSRKVSYGFARLAAGSANTNLTTLYCGPGGNGHGKIMSIVAVGSTLYASLYPQGDSTGHPILKSTNGGTSWSPPSAPNGFAIHGFVQVGKGNEGALGGYVYGLVGGWSGLTTVKLVRVPASSVQNPSAYQWFSGSPSNATWSSSSGSARAIASDSAGMGRPNMTWVPAVGRYLLTASHARSATGSFPKVSVFESPNMWGPWKTVHYDDKFLSASGGFFLGLQFPLSWQSGTTLWASFSCHDNGNPGSCGKYHDRFNLIKTTLKVGTVGM